MKAAILAGLFTLAYGCGVAAAADKDALAKQLESDYKALLAKDRNAVSTREAARLLQTSDQRSNAWNYRKAIGLLRTTRSKASIPLLMGSMLQPDRFVWTAEKDFADTLTILTGRHIGVPRTGSAKESEMVEFVKNLVSEWWNPQRDKISTNQAGFSDEQLENVLACLIALAERQMSPGSRKGEVDTAYAVSSIIRHCVLHRSSSDDPGWVREDLSANMVPVMLKMVGWEKGKKKPTDRAGAAGANAAASQAADTVAAASPPMIYEIIPMLSQLRKDKNAPELDKVAMDEAQPAACRLTCLLALYGSNGNMPTEPLVSIARNETRLSVRLAAIISLSYSTNKAAAYKAALSAMRDENNEVISAGAYALRGLPHRDSVPSLWDILDKCEPKEAILPAISALGEIRTAEAANALADFLEAASKDSTKDRYIIHALMALDSVTGKSFMRAGASREAQQTLAAEAVKWWRAQKGRLPVQKPRR